MKRFATAYGLAILLVLACDEPVSLPPTGTLSIRFAQAQDAASLRLDPEDRRGAEREPGRPIEPPDEAQLPEMLRGPEESSAPQSHFSEYHIRLQGQSGKDTTVSAGVTSVTLGGLAVGTYAVIVEGLVNDSVDYYGRADGVQVAKGVTAEADLRSSFQSVRPTLTAFSATPTTDLRVRATFIQVAIATSYRVEWDNNPAFTNPVTNVVAATQTGADVTVSDSGTYHVRVFAVTTATSNIRPSDTQILRVRRDGVGDDYTTGPGLRTGFGAVTDTLKGLNITPAGDEDWFRLTACMADTIVVETRASRLTPPSPLNTVLRIFRSDGTTQVGATNDNIDGSTTDSRIRVAVPDQDTFRIEVTGAGNSTGHYQLLFQVLTGPNNSGSDCIPRADPRYSLVSVSPGSVTAGQAATFTLTARDQTNTLMTIGGATVAFGVTGGTSNGTIGSVVDNNNGTYTATFTGQTAGTASTVTATIGGVAVSTTLPTITVTPGTLSKLGFTVPPSSATAGASIAPTIEVAAQDAFGNLISGASGVVTMTIQTNPGTGTLFGSVSKPLVGGLARFDDLKIDKAADGYTLRATSGSLNAATSSGFSIVAASATRLAFVVQPANVTGGDSIKPGIQVAVRDAFGNTVTGFSTSITLVFSNNPGGGSLGGTVTRNTTSGVATFDDIAVNKIANGYVLKAGTPILDSASSSAFNVALGPPKRLLFTVEPGNSAAGQILAPAVKVTVTDNGGNTVTTAGDSVAMDFGVDPTSGAATLSGTKKVKPVSGIATFSNLSIDKSAGGYALRAGSGTMTPDTTAAFSILPGVPARLAFQVQPGNVGAGADIAPSIEVLIQDGFGNLVTTAENFVTIAIGTNPPGNGVLDGAVTQQAVGGVATFNNLSIDKIGSGYTLSASSSGLVGIASGTFNVVASALVSASLSTANASPATDVVANDTDSTIVTVTVRDPAGNPMEGQAVQLAVSGSDNTITQPAGSSNASGVATGRIKSTRAEVKTVTVTVNPGASEVVLTQQPTAQFVADSSNISSSLSTVTAVPAHPDSLPNDGVQQSTITVTVKDVNDNPVPGQSVQLETTGSGTFTQPGATNASGVTVGAITRLTAGNDTIRGRVDPTGSNVAITTRPVVKFFAAPCGLANALQSTVTASQDTLANGSDPVTVTVTVRDCGGTELVGETVAIAVTGSGNVIAPASATSNGSGVATFTVRSTVAQSKTVTATITTATGPVVVSEKPTVIFKPGLPTGLAYRGQPGTTSAGAVIAPAVQVAVVDAFGNTVDTVTTTIEMAFSANPTGATLLGDVSVPVSGGVATFGDLAIQKAGSGYGLLASAPSTGFTSVGSAAFTITSAAASELAFKVEPANIAAGASLSPAVEVKVVDQYGNTVTSATTSITVAIGANGGVDSAGVLSGTKTRSASAGVATFGNLNINRAGPAYTLTAAASGLTGATSSAFNVTAAAPFQLRFKVEPTNTTAGSSITPGVQVAVQDAFGNTVDSVASNVTVSFHTDPTGSATLGGVTTQAASAGIATFSNLSITKAATGYRLKATKGSLVEGLSTTFNINPAAAFKLSFTAEPQTTSAGNAISPAVQVTVQDVHGNAATGFSDSIAVAILANPSGGALSGTRKVVPTLGVSTFSTLSIDKAGNGYTLTATAPGVGVPDTSAAFNITSAAASKLGFVVEPTTAAAGTAIAPAITVHIQDGLGNRVPGTTNPVTLTILANPGAATIIGSNTVAAVDGIATFNNVALDKAAAGYTLEASATGLGKDTSATFTITAGPSNAATSTVSANPTADIAADGAQVSTITVTVRDAFGNPASGRSVTLASNGTGNTFTQPASTTNASGVTTGTIATTVPETKTITATADGSVVITQQATVTFTAATISPTQSTVEVAPPTLAADGVASATITVTVKSNDGTPVAGQTVQLGVSGTGNTVTQPAAVTNGSGVATGSVTSTVAQIKTITATVNPGAGQSILTQQPTVTFTAGPPAKVGFIVQPVNVAAGASIAPAIQAAIQDAQGNTVDTAIRPITLAIKAGTGTSGAALYGTTTQASAAGLATFADITLDSAGTAYQLDGSAAGVTTGASAAFNVLVGPPFTVTVSPTADSIYSLGDNVTFTAVAKDSVGNVIPDATFSWSSANEPVAIVDGFGTVTAQARGLATITAMTGGKSGDASLAVAIRLLAVTGVSGIGSPPSQVFSSGDVPGVLTQMNVTTFNATTPAALRASYDVILISWNTDPALNTDWATRMVPFMEAGGGIIFEDPYNIGDLSPGVTGALDENPGAGIALLEVPSMTDGILSQFSNAHTSYTTWSDSLAYFILRGSESLGLYGRINSGCIILNGPDISFHGNRSGTATEVNEYTLFLQELVFAADCPLRASPGTPASVRVFPKSLTFTNSGQNLQLDATALDDVGTPVPGAPITWFTLNDSVATVNGTGLVTSVNDGQAHIGASGSGGDYSVATVSMPAAAAVNAWGTEVAQNTLSNTYLIKTWGTGSNNLFAVGAGGQIRRFNGTSWDTLATPTTNWLWGVWGFAGDNVYAVGDGGVILHWDGSNWTSQSNPAGTYSVRSVWGSGPNDIWAVGDGGFILHSTDGLTWTDASIGSAGLWGVWGSAWNDIWAVGDVGTILHYDGVSWTDAGSPVTHQLLAIAGSGPNNIFAVGQGGQSIVRYDGTNWATQTNPSSEYLYGVWTSSANEAFAVGYQTMLRYNGTAWSKMSNAASNWVLGVWGRAGGQLRAVGAVGEVFRGVRGASIATVEVTPSGASVFGVSHTKQYTALPKDASNNVVTPTSLTWGTENSSVATVNTAGLATSVGSGQASLRANADGFLGYGVLTVTVTGATATNLFDSTSSPTTSWLWASFGTAANNVFAGGLNGVIVRYNGSVWSTTTTPSGVGGVRSIWGSSSTDLWAVTDGGYILRSTNGTTWTTHTTLTATSLYGVWGAAPNDVWAVSAGGGIYHYDGFNWTFHSGSPGLYAIWGASRDTVYAVGASGAIRRFNGTTWESITPVTGALLYRVWGVSGRDVFAVGSGGTILRFDGSNWNTMTSNTTASLYGVWGAASNDVYAVGAQTDGIGTVMRFNGTSWSPLVSRTVQPVYTVWGSNASNVWLGANLGFIRRGVRAGAISASQQIAFTGTNSVTKMNIASNGSTYHYANGGIASSGRLYEYTTGGVFIDSTAFTGIDNRSILYRSGTYYLKSYGSNWYTVNAQTGASTLVFSTGFSDAQSVPAITLTGALEILEFTGSTIRRINPSTGALNGTVTGFTAGAYSVATDGYYIYTWNQSTRVVSVYSARIAASATAQAIGTFTLPQTLVNNSYSLSYANGMLWASSGTTWYGFRLSVTP